MKILDEEIPLIENLMKSFGRYKYLWLLLMVSIVLDSLSTVWFMYNEGIKFEANILIRYLAMTLGIIPGVILGKSLQVLTAVIFSALSLKHSRAVLILLLCLNLLATYHNL